MIRYHILIKDCNYVNKTKDMVISMHICNEFYCSVWFSSNLGILKDKTLSLKFLCLEKALAMTIIVAHLLVSKLFKDMELADVYYYRSFISHDWYFSNLSIDKNKFVTRLLMFQNISLFFIYYLFSLHLFRHIFAMNWAIQDSRCMFLQHYSNDNRSNFISNL